MIWWAALQHTTGQAQNAEYSTSGELAEPLVEIPVVLFILGGGECLA